MLKSYIMTNHKGTGMVKKGEFKNDKLEKFRLDFSRCRNPDVAPLRTDLCHSLRKRTENPRLFDNTEPTANFMATKKTYIYTIFLIVNVNSTL